MNLVKYFTQIVRTLRYYGELRTLHFPSEFEKREILKKFQRSFNLKVFIETGTYLGNTVDAMLPCVDQIVSIELDSSLATRAVVRFDGIEQVKILQGDSGRILPTVLNSIFEPALFWLDGHYSGGNTGGDPKQTPILQEIDAILRHAIKGHVILIDDARLFVGKDGYPTLHQLVAFVAREAPSCRVNVYADIIRIYPSEFSPFQSSQSELK